MDSAIDSVNKKYNVQDSWKIVNKSLRIQVGEDLYNSWFTRLEPHKIENGVLTLSLPTLFLKSWIKSRYSDKLLEIWKAEIPEINSVELRVRNHGEKKSENSNSDGYASTNNNSSQNTIHL